MGCWNTGILAIDHQELGSLHFIASLLFYIKSASGVSNRKIKTLFRIWPVHTSRTQKSTSTFMMKTMIHLNISSEGWMKGLSQRNNPVEDWPFQTLCIIWSCVTNSFLNLRKQSMRSHNLILMTLPAQQLQQLHHQILWSGVPQGPVPFEEEFWIPSAPAFGYGQIQQSEGIWMARSIRWPYSVVKDYSGLSACSPIHRRPFMISAWILHSTCAVWKKWWPWETSRSLRQWTVSVRWVEN